MQFSGSIYGDITFTVAPSHCGISDAELPAMLIQRRAKWQPGTEHTPLNPRTVRSSLMRIGVSWPSDLPLQKALAEIHVNWINAEVINRLDNPTHIELVGDLRYVEVLGLYGIVFQESSRTILHSYSLQVSPDDPKKLISNSTPVSLLQHAGTNGSVTPWLIPHPKWIHVIVGQLLAGYGDAAQAKAFSSDTTLAEMVSHTIENFVLNLVCSREWTESIANAFVKDTLVSKYARMMREFEPFNRMPRDLPPLQPVINSELGDYTHRLARHRGIVSKLLLEQPNLILPYVALLTCHEHDSDIEPVQWVKQQLRKLGGTPRVWRCILKSDGRLFFHALNQFGHPLLAIIWVIALIERCEVSGPMSPRFVRALAPLATWANEHRTCPDFHLEKYRGIDNPLSAARVDPIVLAARPLWRHLCKQFASKTDKAGVFPPIASIPQIEVVYIWLEKNHINATKMVGVRSWEKLCDKAQQGIRNCYFQLLKLPDWWGFDRPLKQLQSEFKVAPLVNQYELSVQGALMRNCMQDYQVGEKERKHMFLCAFQADSDKPFAMIELVQLENSWRLVQIRGPANRDIERQLRKRIVTAAKYVAKQMRRIEISNPNQIDGIQVQMFSEGQDESPRFPRRPVVLSHSVVAV